jgi:DNA-binding NarL/FixJ family response regulator
MMKNQAINVVIVEDQESVREGLLQTLTRLDSNLLVQGFSDAESALDAIKKNPVDVILMDIGLPGMDGIEATRRICALELNINIIMLTVYYDNERIFQSLKAGANGYVLKSSPAEELLQAIISVQKGASPMSGSIARRVIESFHQPITHHKRLLSLTEREQQILQLLDSGFRYKEIAAQLFISLDTVRTHIRHIYDKLHVRSRAEAVAKYATHHAET